MCKAIFVPDLIRKREKNEKIVMLTAYDFAFASLLDEAGVDIILVGDSLGTVIQGQKNTLAVTLDEVIYHSTLVVRGAQRALVIADMPFMSYQLGPRDALIAAGRLVKEAGVSGVKLEGGVNVADTIEMIVRAEIPVMGHVGLTPQAYHRMGGHRVQGREQGSGVGSRRRVLEDAKAVEDAGAFSLVLEGIPEDLAAEITESLSIPTIGIGAGANCSGQVLVLHDLLGLSSSLSGSRVPKFVKQYANLGDLASEAIRNYAEEVRQGLFPGREHSYELTAVKKRAEG